MRFALSQHAEVEIARRSIPLRLIEQVVTSPEQRLHDKPGVWICQSRLRFDDGKLYLLRVVVADEPARPLIITAYRTSKVEKYWRPE